MGIAIKKVPLGGELAYLLILHKIFEDDFIAGHKVVVVPANGGFFGVRYLTGRRSVLTDRSGSVFSFHGIVHGVVHLLFRAVKHLVDGLVHLFGDA